MRKQKSPSLWFVLFSLLFFISCRKTDVEIPEAEKPSSIEKFFNLPESGDPRLKAIAQSIRTQEKEHPFLKDFTKRAGWPVWNKVKMLGSGTGNANGRGTSGDSTTLVYIPFVQDSAIIVNSVLAVKLEPSDTAFRILYANNYESFGFDTTVDNSWNARNVFQFFALFEYEIFGHTKFLIKDERLFNTPTDSFTVTLKSINGVAINSRTTDEYTMTICTIQTICSPDPVAPPTSTDNFVRTTDNCYNTSTCNTYNWGNGGTDWTGSGWAPNNGGGGSGGSWGTTTSCMNTSTGTPIACSPGWVPADDGEVMADPNGNYNFDDDNNTIGGYDNTAYPQFNITSQDWPTVENLIPKSDFVPLPSPQSNCLTLAKQQLAKKNYQISNYGAPDQTIQIYTTANGADASKTIAGVSYLISALQNGIPVLVGVDNRPGSPNPQTDNSTDHFVVIVGMGTDSKGKFFRFYDNATNLSSKGTNDENKLYYDTNTGTITGKSHTGYATSRPDMYDYIITMIRKSKPL